MDEMVDVVDRDDAEVGTATRSEVHASGAWHRGVHVLVFNSRRELLIQRRSATKDKAPGALDLSVSEHARAGESFEEAALRGLREELGIESAAITPLLKFRMEYGPGDNMISTLFRSDYAGSVRPDSSEVEEVLPMNHERLSRLLNDPKEVTTAWTREILNWYLSLPSKVEVMG